MTMRFLLVSKRLLAGLATVAVPLLAISLNAQFRQGRDDRPPTIRILSPADGDRVRTFTPDIKIVYQDEGSGVSVVSFRLMINGRDHSADFDHYRDEAVGRIASGRPLSLGENRITVALADRAGNVGRTEARFVNEAGGWLAVRARPGAEPIRNVALILDASGSMGNALGVSTRMEVAKDAVKGLIDLLPATTHLGLRVFRDCDDIRPVVSIGTSLVREVFLTELEQVQPGQGTAIVASLLESLAELRFIPQGERVAVLVTDGGESCGGSIGQAVNEARDASTQVIVIGFDIDSSGLNRQLKTLAEATGGAFFDARDPGQLRQTLDRSVLRFGYRVFDMEGAQVASGDVGGVPIELAAGEYQVRLDTTPPLLLNDVRIGFLSETSVELFRTTTGISGEVTVTEEESRERVN